MADGLKVNYDILNECISELKTITVQVGGDEIARLLTGLDNIFVETNSDAAKMLCSVKSKYLNVNNKLVAIARNAIDVLEMAMMAYEAADAEMKGTVTTATE